MCFSYERVLTYDILRKISCKKVGNEGKRMRDFSVGVTKNTARWSNWED